MTPEQVEANYRELGLEVTYFDDPPGREYRFHRHGETRLFGISGLGYLKIGDEGTLHTIEPGQEIIVRDGELHGGEAGPEG